MSDQDNRSAPRVLYNNTVKPSISLNPPTMVQDFGKALDPEKGSEPSSSPAESQGTGKTPDSSAAAQDWTGPDDPDNAQNWPVWKRMYHTAATALLAFAVTFGSSVYTPGYREVAERFHVSGTAALLGLSLYVLSLGLGPVIAAPLSETFGRTIVYRLSAITMLFTLGAGFSQTFAQFLVCRFFAGMFGSPALAVGAGTNADMWPPHKRAIASSLFVMAPFLGPGLGPIAGGFSAMNKGWRWTQWDLLFVCVAVYTFSLGLDESYKKIILKRRAKRLGVAPPPAARSGLAEAKFVFKFVVLRPIHMLFTEPIVLVISIYNAFVFAVLFSFFAAFPIVFEGIYAFNPGESGLVFLAVGIGVVLAVFTGIFANRKLYMKHYRRALAEGRTTVAPEHRLYIAMCGSAGLPLSLFWFAWSANKNVSWASPAIATIPFGWGNLCIFLGCSLFLIDTYGPLNGASALAANGLLRYVLGAAFPLFTVQMYEALGVGWATSIFGFVSLALMPIPWVFFRWGPAIRARSSYETIKA
ncbi:hypothetical protein MBLNU459_g5405t1 [Dothideomycetes sp. NU459]